MNELEIKNYVQSLKAKGQLTGDKVEAIQLGNDCYIYVNDEKVTTLNCI